MEKIKIGIIGLGYVGLPLAVAFDKHFETVGFDVNKIRIEELKAGVDSTQEVEQKELTQATIEFSFEENSLESCNVLIVTVPTPIDNHRQPDLTPLVKASELLGRVVRRNDVVIYESTVYPGATEEDCIPVIEKVSGLIFNRDFYAGYSPERINPGDKARPVTKIVKVTSGSTPEIADFVDNLYKKVIDAGTYKASSIKVAEASKIIENTQRDVNIALINELSMIFSELGIDTNDVIDAASTKWNFINMRPGLVGGHCIGVDPYYLMHKSMSVGYIPDMIRTAREINDGMPKYVAQQVIKAMINRELHIKGAKILILGLTFKENCPDMRNTKVVDLIRELESFNTRVDVYDEWVDKDYVRRNYEFNLLDSLEQSDYDAIVLAVSHEKFVGLQDKVFHLGKKGCLVFDMKAIIKDRRLGQVRI
tara:strand:- start:6119 stop:7384 length:1266 start_codon:yes stop_codon:yes gene_type:complete